LFHHSIKIQTLALLGSAIILALCFVPVAQADDEAAELETAPTVDEQILGLEAMCAANAEAMAERQEEESLYLRLGGEEKIREIVIEIVRLHDEDENFDRFMDNVDQERLIDGVTQFLVVGTGGPGEYEGPNMVDAHAHLLLTNADFLAAGGDVMEAMASKGCGEEEIQEIICTLVSMRSLVVVESDKVVE
jgi:hemoglobin